MGKKAISEEIKIIAYSFFRAIEIDGKYYRKRIGKSKLKLFQDGVGNLAYLFLYKNKHLKFALKAPATAEDNESDSQASVQFIPE